MYQYVIKNILHVPEIDIGDILEVTIEFEFSINGDSNDN